MSQNLSEYKPIPEMTGYFINKNGDIIFIRNIKNSRTMQGYKRMSFERKGKWHMKSIHRLLALTFIPNPENKPHINHKNGIKDDNRLENLEWCTDRENKDHAKNNHLYTFGEDVSTNKLNEKQVRLIKHLKYIKPKIKQRELSKIFKVSQGCIALIHMGRNWKHVIV